MTQARHPQAMLTIRARRWLVTLVEDDGWPVARAAERFGVSRTTAHKWVRRFRAEGLAGLADRSCAPHRRPHRISRAREQTILARRRAHLEGPAVIAAKLGENPSTVHRVLARHHQPSLRELDRPTRMPVRRYERDRPGELIHMDVKRQGRIPAGGGWRTHGRAQAPRLRDQRPAGQPRDGHPRLGYDYLHIAVDDHSRLAYTEIHPDERQHTAAGFAERAIAYFAAHNAPVEQIMTDNGSCYRSRPFAAVLAAHGITHRRTRPYRPQTNGKVERLNLTLKHEWAYARAYTDNNERAGWLARYLHYYNWHRPHTALGGRPPAGRLPVNDLARHHS